MSVTLSPKNKTLRTIQVVPGVKRSLSRRNDPEAEKANEEFERQRLAILKRDDWTCRGEGCGFSSSRMENAPAGGMEVHHIDDNHHNNDPKNLITLCPYCHMSFTLGRRGASYAGVLGLLPGIRQGELNLIFHTVWGLSRAVEMIEDDEGLPEKERRTRWTIDDVPDEARAAIMDARSELNRLVVNAQSNLRSELDSILPDLGEVETLYAVLMELPQEEYEERHRILEHVRLLPVVDAFEKHIDLWAENLWLKNYPPTVWEKLVKDVRVRLSSPKAKGSDAKPKGSVKFTGGRRVRP